jgi:F-type H+-transporting ATPase subunit h
VKNYSLPPSPKAPSLPADLAAALSEYDAAEPTLASAAPTKAAASATEDTGSGADEFLNFLEKDLPKEEAHH